MYTRPRIGCDITDAFAQTTKSTIGLTPYQSHKLKSKAIGDTWATGPTPVQVTTYAAAAKERRREKLAMQVGTATPPTRIVPQGLPINTEQVFNDTYLRQMQSVQNMAGHVPVQGLSLPQAQLGVPFTQQVPDPNIPFNPLAFNSGMGSQIYSSGVPNNGLPYEWQGTLGLIGDYAGTVTDPYSGQTYAAYTDSMPEPLVMNEEPVIKLGEPSRMLEALTGTLSFPKPIKQEQLVDFADVAEGLTLPQGYLDTAVEQRIAQQAAGESFMVNNETPAGYNDTAWDGYIGDTFVLRPVIDTQTLQDNSQTNTVEINRLQQPQVNAAFQLGEGLGAHNGTYFQPVFNLLAEARPTAPGRPKRDLEVNGYWSMAAANTSGYAHRMVDVVTARENTSFTQAGSPDMVAASDGNATDRTSAVKVGQALAAEGGPITPMPAASDTWNTQDGGIALGAPVPWFKQPLQSRMPFAHDGNVDESVLQVAAPLAQTISNYQSMPSASDGVAKETLTATVNSGIQAPVTASGPVGMTHTGAQRDASLQTQGPLQSPHSLVSAIPAVQTALPHDAAAQRYHSTPQVTGQYHGHMPMQHTGNQQDASAQLHAPLAAAPNSMHTNHMPLAQNGMPTDAIPNVLAATPGQNQAYGANINTPVSQGKQGLNNVISMLAGAGVFGPTTDAPMPSIATAGTGSDSAAYTQPALRTAASGVPQDMYLTPTSTSNWHGDAQTTVVPQALDLQGSQLAALPSNRDGTQAYDSMVTRNGVPPSLRLDVAAMPTVSDNLVNARCDTGPLRVANNATFYWTGQSIGDQHLESVPSALNTKDSTDEAARRQFHGQYLFEQNARAHKSTYGTGAEFRNTYEASADRPGLISMNPDTVRLMTSPALAAMDRAAAEQLRKRDIANMHKHASMFASQVAYESDFNASDVE